MASSLRRRPRRSTLSLEDLLPSREHRHRNLSNRPRLGETSASFQTELPSYIDCGDCEHVCSYCGVLFWLSEQSALYSRKAVTIYSRCCKLGRVVIPPSQVPPPALSSLFTDRLFREDIRPYNALFSMTPFGAKIGNTVNDGYGPYTFKISGQICHWLGRLCPEPNSSPRFLQLYIYDSANEVSNRLSVYNDDEVGNLSVDVVTTLTQTLGSVNKYVQLFKTSSELGAEQAIDDYAIRLYNNISDYRYGVPAAGLIGGIVSGDDSNASSFDIIVYSKSGNPQRINKLHPAYMPLQYPIIFPYGDPGWSTSLKQFVNNVASSKPLTINMYYSYLCHDRQPFYSLIVKGGRLFQQFPVDSYVCIEEIRFDYIRTHQNELRSEYVSGIYDAISRGDSDGSSVGKRVYLPSTFVGGPRYMYSHYQDALALCRVYGNPQYFITFTCNAGWDEVKRFTASHDNCQPQDRPDILSRIFRMKVLEFISFLKLDKSFGDVTAYLYTIEFQKGGLPHCHTLLWVSSSSRVNTDADVDRYISVELPDPDKERDLYNIITSCMLHGPCGFLNFQEPCMRERKCRKGFPKPFISNTFFDKDGYVHYKRRDVSTFTTSNGIVVHNGFVVPYNKRLCSRFKAHINVEYCGWNMLIKYLFKYISKGVERVAYSLQLNNNSSHNSHSTGASSSSSVYAVQKDLVDEVHNFLEGRFICPHEAAWRIFNFPIHERHPTVQILDVHLEGMQTSTFRSTHNLETLTRSATFGRTTLTRWLACNTSVSLGRHLTYVEYPSLFRWDLHKKDWIQRASNYTPLIGRLVYVHPTSGELFYLRMLLSYQIGCQCFEDIRSVKDQVYPTFRLACVALGLIGDDKEWLTAFMEASSDR